MTDRPDDEIPGSALPEEPAETVPAATPRFPELEALQQEVERRIRDNRKFLERFLDDDYIDEEATDDDATPEDFEEL